jgi:pimeloyl-ACP methyl ester carboxylesterase
MRITKYIPQLLPLVIRATVAYIDKGRAQDLFQTACANSAADMLALQNPKICALMEKGFVEGLQQGSMAVRRDCFLAITDFSDEAKRLKHKFHVIHGDDDKVVLLHQSKAFADFVPGTELEIVKGAGALLIYSHWERVLQAIQKKQTN